MERAVKDLSYGLAQLEGQRIDEGTKQTAQTSKNRGNEDLPEFEEKYTFNGKTIEARVEMYINDAGCYMAHVKHRLYKPKLLERRFSPAGEPLEESSNKEEPWEEMEVVLNGRGVNKCKRKVGRQLKAIYEPRFTKHYHI